MQLDDSAIRAQIHADVLTAWNPQLIYDSDAMEPASVSELPRAFVRLHDMEFNRNQRTASIAEVEVPHVYTISGQFPVAADVSVEIDKVRLAQALIDKLMDATKPRYIDKWVRNILAIRYADITVGERAEPAHELSIDFEVLVNASLR